MPTRISTSLVTILVSIPFITKIPIDYKITNFPMLVMINTEAKPSYLQMHFLMSQLIKWSSQ